MTWPSVAFSDALVDVSGGNAKIPQSEYRSSGSLAVVDQGRELVGGFTDDLTARHRSRGPVIVFGDHTKALKWIDFPFAMGADGVKVLEAKRGWEPKFIYHYLRSVNLPAAGYSRHFKFLKDVSIPQPPIDEQRRISAILDQAASLTALSADAVSSTTAAVQALFQAMFGTLEAEMASGASPKFQDAVRALEGGRNLVGPDADEATPYRVLRISAVTSGTFKADESKPLPSDYVPDPKHLVRTGDLLISRANTTAMVGATALVGNVPDNLALPDKLWRVVWRDPSSVNPIYALALLHSPAVRRELSARSSGTGGSMKNISQAKLMVMPFPMAPPAEQAEFAQAAGTVQELKDQAARRLAQTHHLLKTLQSRAFSGTL